VKQSTNFRFILPIVLCVEFVVLIGIDSIALSPLGVLHHASLKVLEANAVDDRLFGGLLNQAVFGFTDIHARDSRTHWENDKRKRLLLSLHPVQHSGHNGIGEFAMNAQQVVSSSYVRELCVSRMRAVGDVCDFEAVCAAHNRVSVPT
jgi:hypothetical protein